MGLVSGPGIYLARWISTHTNVRLQVALVETMIVIGAFGIFWQAFTGAQA